MTVDATIIVVAVVGIGVALLAQAVIFRVTGQEAIITGVKMVFAVGILVCLAAAVWLHFANGAAPLWELALEAGGAATICCLALYAFIFYGLGAAESSIQVEVLHLVHAHGGGLRRDELRARLSERVLARKRLDRFIRSGDLRFDGRSYHLARPAAALQLQTRLILFLTRLMRLPDRPPAGVVVDPQRLAR